MTSNWPAGILLTVSLLGIFAVTGTLERWGAEEPVIEQHRLVIDLTGCSPAWERLTPVVEVTIESTSDLGWTAIGCTRHALPRAKPVSIKTVLMDGMSGLSVSNPTKVSSME